MERGDDTQARQAQVGRQLAALRAKAGMSQAAAGKRLGISQTSVARFEAGSRRLTFLDALAFASLYGASLDSLVPRADSAGHG